MAAPAVTAFVTLDEFYRMADLPKGTELADGVVVVTPSPSSDHGYLGRDLFRALDAFVRAEGLGEVFFDNFGYDLPIPGRPHTQRIPDVSFVRADRVPRPRPRRRAFAIAPDLAVEILSDSDRRAVLAAKLADYRDAGTRLAWLIDPDARTVEVQAPPGVTVRRLGGADVLDGGEVLPGFALPLPALFAALDD